MHRETFLRHTDILKNNPHHSIDRSPFSNQNTVHPELRDGIYTHPIDLTKTRWPLGSFRWLGYLSNIIENSADVASIEAYGCAVFAVQLGLHMLGATTLTLQEIVSKAWKFGLIKEYGAEPEMIQAMHRDAGFPSCTPVVVDHPLNLPLQPHQVAYTTIMTEPTPGGFDSHWIVVLPNEPLRKKGKLLIADSEWGQPSTLDTDTVRTMGLLLLGRPAIDASFFDIDEEYPHEGYTVLEPPKTIFWGHMLVCSR